MMYALVAVTKVVEGREYDTSGSIRAILAVQSQLVRVAETSRVSSINPPERCQAGPPNRFLVTLVTCKQCKKDAHALESSELINASISVVIVQHDWQRTIRVSHAHGCVC